MPMLFRGHIVRPRLDVLISPGFVLGLALLLANDFVLKDAWPGFVTGKLSDFAGLFAFALFWAALLPRHLGAVYLLTAAAWLLWKSPASQAGIDAWNATPLFDIARVVDYTDLAALAVLPVSYAYFVRVRRAATSTPTLVRRTSAVLAMGVAAFAFGATSYDNYGLGYYAPQREGVYLFPDDIHSVVARINSLSLDEEDRPLHAGEIRSSMYTFWIAVPTTVCGQTFDAQVDLRRDFSSSGGDSWAELLKIELEEGCTRDTDLRAQLYADFERYFVEPLDGVSVLDARAGRVPPGFYEPRTPIPRVR
jgi:hypothetical protein